MDNPSWRSPKRSSDARAAARAGSHAREAWLAAAVPSHRPFPHNRSVTRRRCHRTAMLAYVYKSLKKADTYLYLATRDDFERVPPAVRAPLGNLQFVLEVALTPERRLAQADPAVVRANLVARGFHLQLPPTMADPMTDDWGTDA
jgi:uncharacterized protein YcgL (UPF0745 family)